VISLPAASRKAIHLACWSSAGYGTPHPVTRLNPHSARLFTFRQSAIASPRTHIKPKSSLAQPLPPGLATFDPTKPP
jgi:hypothetical protein